MLSVSVFGSGFDNGTTILIGGAIEKLNHLVSLKLLGEHPGMWGTSDNPRRCRRYWPRVSPCAGPCHSRS